MWGVAGAVAAVAVGAGAWNIMAKDGVDHLASCTERANEALDTLAALAAPFDGEKLGEGTRHFECVDSEPAPLYTVELPRSIPPEKAVLMLGDVWDVDEDSIAQATSLDGDWFFQAVRSHNEQGRMTQVQMMRN